MLIWFPEKFLRRVFGRTDLEDGIKKLDKLTNEEVAMASAHLLKVTHNIDDNVMKVDENMRVVNDNIKVVDDKVQTMADGGQHLLSGRSAPYLTPIYRRHGNREGCEDNPSTNNGWSREREAR